MRMGFSVLAIVKNEYKLLEKKFKSGSIAICFYTTIGFLTQF